MPDDKDQLWVQAGQRLAAGQRDEGRRFYRTFIQRFPQDARAPQAYLVIGQSFIKWPVKLLFEPQGVLIGLVHFSMPTMILILAAAISHIDPAYERAAESLGARPSRVFLRVTIPLSLPGIVSGALVVFAWTFSAFPTPELLGGGRVKMIANVVKDLALDSFNWPGSGAFAVVALALTLGVLALTGGMLGRTGARS